MVSGRLTRILTQGLFDRCVINDLHFDRYTEDLAQESAYAFYAFGVKIFLPAALGCGCHPVIELLNRGNCNFIQPHVTHEREDVQFQIQLVIIHRLGGKSLNECRAVYLIHEFFKRWRGLLRFGRTSAILLQSLAESIT